MVTLKLTEIIQEDAKAYFGRTTLRREIHAVPMDHNDHDDDDNEDDNKNNNNKKKNTSPRITSDRIRNHPQHHLKFIMLGCEDQRPYGPTDHTATMLLNLITKALEELFMQQILSPGFVLSNTATMAHQHHHHPTTSTMIMDRPPRDHHHHHQHHHVDVLAVVTITIYNVQQLEYPTSSYEWDWYDGVLLPGSFSSAYQVDEQPWIQQLGQVIQHELYAKQRPTMGICFGHQLYAHSFRPNNNNNIPPGNNNNNNITITISNCSNKTTTNDHHIHHCHYHDNHSFGLAVPVPVGPQGGRTTWHLTKLGQSLLLPSSCSYPTTPLLPFTVEDETTVSPATDVYAGLTSPTTTCSRTTVSNPSFHLYCTHCDMVQQIPNCAISLGGNDHVPIQAAAYYYNDYDNNDNDATATIDNDETKTKKNLHETHDKDGYKRPSNNTMIPMGNEHDNDDDNNDSIPHQGCLRHRRPVAMTFQSHPEYVMSPSTLQEILQSMTDRGHFTKDEYHQAQEDAMAHYHVVYRQSIQLMIAVGQVLGWFPTP